jgi:serine/threonine protein kinase
MSEHKLSSQLASGAALDQYTLQSLLGRGINTEIYRAAGPDPKVAVAVKVFHSPTTISTGQKARFRTEAEAVLALKHPNIIRLYGFGSGDRLYYLAMELVEGTSLRDMISAHPTGLGRDNTMLIFIQIASAIACAHDQNVLHGNIKPNNVLVDNSQRPVLTDFSLPCLAESIQGVAASSTPAYMAPEQATESATTPQSDIYALGILLYEMVTGDVPFKGETPDQVISKHMHVPPRPPSQLNVALDPRFEHVILKALNKKPADRYASVRDMINDLESEDVVAGEYQTLTIKREDLTAPKRRSEIRRFERTRVDQPADKPDLSTPLNPAVLIVGLLLVVLVIALIVLVL